MLELEGELPEVYLQPGELHLAREPVIIRTLLGSCVGITFWSARLRIGALCHALLPRCPNGSSAGVSRATGRRYVDYCVRDLARQFDELGVPRAEVQVKVFGGADVLLVSNGGSRATVGRQNCDVALEVLRAEGFDVIASSLGGTVGRNIQFNTGTGEVLLRRLTRVIFEDVIDE
ncbi:MAG TPA: chemotaxis protein CheD [Terriglobia bacterium]|nr:chemotaxis protein CheD [Terriglobia bacterium]